MVFVAGISQQSWKMFGKKNVLKIVSVEWIS